MIIFQILYSLDVGGIEEFASNMSEYLSADGIQNYIILLSAGRDKQWCDNKKKKILDQGTEVMDYGNLSKFNKIKQLTSLIDDIKPDIVIIHHELNTLRIVPFIKRRGIKYLQIQHNTKINGVSAHRFFAKYMVHKYVAVSADVRDSLAAAIHLKEQRIDVIENGVVISNYNNSDTTDETVKILAAGRFTEQKNFIELANILKELLASESMKNIEITIAGCGETYDEVTEIIGGDVRVSLPGAVDNMKQLFADADIYISYSLYEGLSLTLLEAMASGCAVLITDTGGCRNIIEDGVTGYITDVRDKQTFLIKLIELVKDKGLRRKYSAEVSKESVNHDFSITYQKYNKLFKTLAEPD